MVEIENWKFFLLNSAWYDISGLQLKLIMSFINF